jgi:hypothetical protein
MKRAIHLEYRASSSWSKHEGESSLGLCDRLDRTRDNSQRQLPTDHDYAVPTREYQTDQSSLKSAQAAARSVLGKKQKQRQRQKQPHRSSEVDTVTPYQANALTELRIRSAELLSVRRRSVCWLPGDMDIAAENGRSSGLLPLLRRSAFLDKAHSRVKNPLVLRGSLYELNRLRRRV